MIRQITTPIVAERRLESRAAAIAARRQEQRQSSTTVQHLRRVLREDARTHTQRIAEAVGVCAC